MRNYWLKILLGALGIFVAGMIGVTAVRSGIAKVNRVVEGSGPLTIPLGLIPFTLQGERLGNLDHVTLNRESPRKVTDVELEIDLSDSLLAKGLSGCRLAANFEGGHGEKGVNIKVGKDGNGGAFRCVSQDSTPSDLVEYGVAIFQPGEIEVPLLLPADVVSELQTLDFGDDSAGAMTADSIAIVASPNTDSIEAEVARQLRKVDSIKPTARRLADSIRREARRQMAEDADSQ